MDPVHKIPPDILKEIRFVLCDIDDTLTLEGMLPAESFSALHRLNEMGYHVIPVTGRPAGWCDHIARFWPVSAVVGENGAFYFRYDRAARKMYRCYRKNAEQRKKDRALLNRIAEQVMAEVPGSAIAADQAFREADLAVDFREGVPPLSFSEVERIVAIFHTHGAKAKVSSIHVNGWFGDYDKLSMTTTLLRDDFGLGTEESKSCGVFVGDSPNDCPMFAHFPFSVGVANILNFTGRLNPPPKWITSREGGHGFAEFVDLLQGRVD